MILQNRLFLPRNLIRLAYLALDQLLPPRCLKCGVSQQDSGRICAACWKELNFIQSPLCDCCGYPFENFGQDVALCAACQVKIPPFDRARAALRYDQGSRAMILAFKHGDRTEYARFFAHLLLQAGQSLCSVGTIVAPVPLHRRRLGARRYNQAALMANIYAGKNHLDYWPDLLSRLKHTPPQQGNFGRRSRNVAGVFKVRDKYQACLKGRNILLIDDVYTTGATAGACAKILKGKGAAKVDILTLARVART